MLCNVAYDVSVPKQSVAAGACYPLRPAMAYESVFRPLRVGLLHALSGGARAVPTQAFACVGEVAQRALEPVMLVMNDLGSACSCRIVSCRPDSRTDLLKFKTLIAIIYRKIVVLQMLRNPWRKFDVRTSRGVLVM